MAEAFICAALRTPIGRYGGALATVRADDLAAVPIRALLSRHPGLDPAAIDDLILGCANQAGEDNRNVARMAALLAGLPTAVPGVTVNRLCGSGMEAVGGAARAIRAGEAELVIAGGIESMSRAPFVLGKAESAFARAAELHDTTLGWRFVNPLIEAQYGVHSMPETAENVAADYQIRRADQDAFALRSQQRAAAAIAAGRLALEIVPVAVGQKRGASGPVEHDEHPRPETTLEKLAGLPTPFREGGTVTAGNASGNQRRRLRADRGLGGGRPGAGARADGARGRHGERRRAAPGDGHRPGAGDPQAPRAHRAQSPGHGRDRAQRGVCEPGAGRAPRARPRR